MQTNDSSEPQMRSCTHTSTDVRADPRYVLKDLVPDMTNFYDQVRAVVNRSGAATHKHTCPDNHILSHALMSMHQLTRPSTPRALTHLVQIHRAVAQSQKAQRERGG